jgi:hypothetical protein
MEEELEFIDGLDIINSKLFDKIWKRKEHLKEMLK